jgi:hypothetical protein
MSALVQNKPCITRRMVNSYFRHIGRSYEQEMKVLGLIIVAIWLVGWWFRI